MLRSIQSLEDKTLPTQSLEEILNPKFLIAAHKPLPLRSNAGPWAYAMPTLLHQDLLQSGPTSEDVGTAFQIPDIGLKNKEGLGHEELGESCD